MAQIIDLASLDGGPAQAASARAVELPEGRKRVMLAGVKSQIYHPSLPTLRQMDIDSANSRLPDEHCRTTTFLTKGDFDQAHFTLLGEPKKRLACLETVSGRSSGGRVQASSPRAALWRLEDVTETGQRLTERYREGKLAPLHQANWPKLTQAVEDCSRFISAAGEFKLPKVERKIGFSSYAVRYLKPNVTQSWRYCLNQNSNLNRYGPQPLPIEGLNVFRHFGSSYSRSKFLLPWR
ncbi:testis, prostate and placenta-expressed protein isoform X1 [Tachyglossus aculeatus]|uniref:testis, prostate and placenta-expressed protein isoform X1 n=1 Tax=Tachyglossus aculeatus TaxID=9261 RepID=UPI0018F59008|nr:testis, prostate and placenta-expressed protein isoform X1 [Tachyglossus aculeatus]